MGKVVLTVDDSPSIRQMVSFTLAGAGYEVVEASDGKAVIAHPLDCIACWGCESFCPAGCFDVSPERARGEMVSPY